MAKAALVVVAPNGHRSRVPIEMVPFRIGRHVDNDLVLQDSRTSRNHAQIVMEDGAYAIEDAGSRHGVFVNGQRVERHRLKNADCVDFGVPDSYQLFFTPEGSELTRLVESTDITGAPESVGGNLGRLKAVLEIARTLQTSYSMQDVLNSVVDAALAVTGAERGFLFLRDGTELTMRCSRDCRCGTLPEESLRVPKRVLAQALQSRSELLSMTFEAPGAERNPGNSIADLEIRGVVCVPLVRVNAAPADAKTVATGTETAGVLYMDSRVRGNDMAAGNRELLQALAIEASVIVENARLLDEEREKKKMDEELRIAREIQQRLLPKTLPQTGWLRAMGSSTASLQVGGDYFDVARVTDDCWAVLVVDVSGKGVSSALVASVLQGAFLTIAEGAVAMEEKMLRVNRFLAERMDAGKYATIFHATIERAGTLRYINAGHCSPFLVSRKNRVQYLETTGMPVGMIEEAEFDVEEIQIEAGDKVVIYSDGVTDAQNPEGIFFGRKRLRETIENHVEDSTAELHDAIVSALAAFTESEPQGDDVTLVVLEYLPA